MLHALAPYGNDASEGWSGHQCGLGRCLRRILPEDHLKQQAIQTTPDSVCFVAAARLDNRSDLVRDLGLHSPEQLPDSTILSRAWDCWGTACMQRLEGAFAFISYDPKTQRLFAARDHAGEYPLFFRQSGDVVAVASMPRALIAVSDSAIRLNERRIADWLVHISTDRRATFFEGIENLPPGHLIEIVDSVCLVEEYWHPSKLKEIRYAKDADYAEELSCLIDRSTSAQLRAIGEAATQLSSGLDSGTITASAASQLARNGKRLTSYTYIPQPEYVQYTGNWRGDEGPDASEVAEFYPNIRHIKVTTQGKDLVATLDSINRYLDEPLGNLTNWIWSLAMMQHARENNISAILQGSMGNSTISFGTAQPLAFWLREGSWVQLVRTVLRGRQNGETSFKTSAKLAFAGLYPSILDRKVREARGACSIEHLALQPEFSMKYKLLETWRALFFDSPWDFDVRRSEFDQTDLALAAMAGKAVSGVELRDPTSSRRIWEFCLSIPIDQYIAGGQSRSLVRRAMRDRLPPSALKLKQPGMQGADWYLTMGPWISELRKMLDWIEESPAACRILDITELKRRAENFPTSRLQEMQTHNYWHVGLLQGISLGTFLRTHDPDAPPPGDWYEEIKAARS